VADNLRADFDQPVSERRHRPLLHGIRQRQCAQEVAEIVGERMQLQANGVVGELAAGETRPPDGVLAFFDMLLCRAALIVEGDDTLGRAGEVGHYEPDPGIEFAWMPFDLGNDAASLAPTGGLVAEVCVVAAHVLRRRTNRALQEVGDIALQNVFAGSRIA